MKHQKLLSFFAAVYTIFFSFLVYAQNTNIEIKGNVFDNYTGIPIKEVTVFLSFTTYHTQSNAQGEFLLEGVIPGTYALQFIAEGYQRASVKIDVDGKTNLRANIVLNKIPNNIYKPIQKLGSLIERDRFVEKFKKEFLGEGLRTYKCEIVNENDIEFDHNGVQVFAESKKPIIILNKSLGYKLTVYINKFEWEWFSDFGGFSLDVYFDELKPTDSFEAVRYAANRLESYKGSFRHFLKACADRKVYSEGFVVFEAAYVPNELGNYEEFKDLVESQRSSKVSRLMESIIKKEGDQFTFDTNSFLEVVYISRREEFNYALYKNRVFGTSDLYDFQDSWVKFPAGKYYFTSRGIGLENEKFSKQLFGYWTWKRVSDILPSDYEPIDID